MRRKRCRRQPLLDAHVVRWSCAVRRPAETRRPGAGRGAPVRLSRRVIFASLRRIIKLSAKQKCLVLHKPDQTCRNAAPALTPRTAGLASGDGTGYGISVAHVDPIRSDPPRRIDIEPRAERHAGHPRRAGGTAQPAAARQAHGTRHALKQPTRRHRSLTGRAERSTARRGTRERVPSGHASHRPHVP